MKNFKLVLLAVLCFTLNSQTVQAGFMDKLKAATDKMNSATQAIGQRKVNTAPAGEDPDKPLHLEDYDKTGSCEGKRSATCMDYGELVDHCMDPLNGYRMKVLADRIENKLKTEKLNNKERKNLEEDLAAAREAQQNKTDNPTIAGEKNSQRYLSDISEEDQIYVNAEYGKFHNKIYNKCIGADHMGVGHRTEMIKDEGVSGDEAVAQYRKNKTKEDAPFNCLASVSGIRYAIMADMMEKKMQGLKLSDKERADWEADIASLREFALNTKAGMPKAVDPANPYRAMMRLTAPDEQMAINNEYSKQSQAKMAECSAMSGNGRVQEREITSGGLVDRSKSPANKNAKPTSSDKHYDDLNKGRGGSTNLLAMRRDAGCADQLKGHLALVTAETLEAKLKSAKNVSAQQRKEWQEDIAAFRAAAAAGKDSAEPPDPDNPYRWYDYVTNQERAEINKKQADFNNKIMKECNSRPSGL